MGLRILWFRRDLRLTDHPALAEAARGGDEVLGLFVRDPQLIDRAGPRAERLTASLAALNAEMNGALVVRTGSPADVVPGLAREFGARSVHISTETTPFGRRRDGHVAARLRESDSELVATGSPYAVTPGHVRNNSGAGYRVFTPFLRAWRQHGWPDPAGPTSVRWLSGVDSDSLPNADRSQAGERAATARWEDFLDRQINGYANARDRADLDRTSRLSIPLKYGELHPRTLLLDIALRSAELNPADVDRFVTELAWREFYADVLWHDPTSAWQDWRSKFAAIRYDDDRELLRAWCEGRTGYPFVDAGMRQLLDEGWMHNRLRMVTASFLVKDLHIWWPAGARHFLDHLLDGDIASNSHGWQWVAGSGCDAAPYFRIFNPVTQGQRNDPDGEYVRRWIPELRHVDGPAVHEPWSIEDGYAHGYPERIVDHAHERRDALSRLDEIKELAL